MPEAGLDEFTSWRCARDNAKFCPAEGCPAHYGCAREHGWKPGEQSPPECRGLAPLSVATPLRETMNEPNFIAQTAEPMPKEERNIWISAQADAGRAVGATFFRVSVHPENPDLLLLEGWAEQPDDQGEQRWQMSSPG